MDCCVPIRGEVIRLPAERSAGGRRRLVVTDWAEGAERIPVLVVALDAGGCRILDAPPGLADATGRFWLKLPDHEAIEIAAFAERKAELACTFLHPLAAAIVEEIAHPPHAAYHRSGLKPRCTFL
ncbi:MAG: hypothetical protein JO276_03180 [Sphingomonadaceae bacterium]|nr:hypothetical protein [Sphingomonadaceae bacterium]